MGRAFWPILLALFFLSALGAAGCGHSSSGEAECVVGTRTEDLDCDGVFNAFDNCPDIANPSQTDADNDGTGDLCEPFPCGDGICDPEGGECDLFEYCTADCTQSLCFGLPGGETCGDGLCQPLAGECSDSKPCLEDCPNDFYCFSPSCGDRICQPWEDDPTDLRTFCFMDCICKIPKTVTDECHANVDCLDQAGTVCGPERFPVVGPGETVDFTSVACHCTLCGNTVLDDGEGCDPSAGGAGLESCFAKGGACNDVTCECLVFEFQCDNSVDDDGDGLIDCLDPDCTGVPPC